MNETIIFNHSDEKVIVDSTSYLYILSKLKKGDFVKERYRIEKVIGKGGVGIVYKAFDTVLNDTVALKFLNPDVTLSERKFYRIKREVNISRNITDERIIKIYSLEEWNDIYFMVMEFIDGESLKDYANKRREKFSWNEFRPLFFEILKGVKALHDKNIIHRDLKPSNILITKEKKIKIVDFGLSKDIEDKTKTSSIGEITGTPEYITPEQVKGTETGFYSDIYQLGVILYNLLGDSEPFEGYSTTLEMIYMKISNKPRKLENKNGEIPDYVIFSIEKAMEIEHRNRFKSIEEFERFLKKEKIGVSDRILYLLSRKKTKHIIMFLIIILFLSATLFIAKNNKIPRKIINKTYSLKVYNPYGFKLFEKNFYPYKIFKAKIVNLKKDLFGKLFAYDNKKTIMVFLNHKDYKNFPKMESINSIKRDAKILYFNSKGKLLEENRDLMKDYSYEFVRNYYFTGYKEYNIKDKKLFFIRLRHFLGMYPTSLFFYDGKEFHNIFHSPGLIANYDIINKEEDNPDFIILANNNLLSHIIFFSKMKISDMKNPISVIPSLDEFRALPAVESEWYALPGYTNIKKCGDNNSFIFYNNKTGRKISLIIKADKFILTVFNGINKTSYIDYKDELNSLYYLFNEYFYSIMFDKDYFEADRIVQKMLGKRINNPFLKSIIFYFKGIVEMEVGEFDRARKSFRKSIYYDDKKSDSVQKLCEIEFLKGDYKKALFISEREYKNLGDFWGLSHMVGKTLFRFYVNLQQGEFFKANENIGVNYFIKDRGKILKGIISLFKGNYNHSLKLFFEILDKKTSPFTILEFRLLFARTAILYNILTDKRIEEDKEIIKLTEFYIKDIYMNSNYKKELSALSESYFLVRNGDKKQAENIAKEYYVKLLKSSNIDFETKFWFFYDSFIYGKTMEIIGNKKEAIRGYRECIKANPFTNLAKRARMALETLKK